MKKILCIVDSYEWALYNRAVNLSANLDGNYTIKHFNDLDSVEFDSFDTVYSLNWPIHGYISKKISRKRKYRLVTSISSHVGRPHASKMKLLRQYDAISTSNQFLYEEFKPVFGKKVFNTPFGVNHELFVPTSLPSENSNVFGWVGNSKRDVKRYDHIVRVFKDIDATLLTVRNGYSREEMAAFYNTVGTVICFSTSEGTPNPILEAASCGRNIISTNVGNVPQLLNGIDINTVRSRTALSREIKLAMSNDELLNKKGILLRSAIESDWTWKKQSRNFILFLGL